MKARLLPLLVMLLGAPAWSASELEAVRTKAQVARTEVRGLRGKQQALRDELNQLAARIEALKAERQGKLTAGAELEAALRRSQELSGALTGLAQAVAGAEGEAERANLALYTSLSAELERVRAAWDGATERGARAELLARMRALRTERDAVRAALPPSRVPALDKAVASDDPEDLLEQADALRDTEDKVRQRLAALKSRIVEVREERALERRMRDFLGEDSIFDEQDRQLRLRTDGTRRIAVDTTGRGGPEFDNPNGIPSGDSAQPPPVTTADPAPGPPATPLPGGPTDEGPVAPPPMPVPSEVSSVTRASDSRPQVDTLRAQQLAAGGVEDLAAMEAEAARLETLARELGTRATQLERRVRELE
jgi:hypothetical protein